MCFVEHLRHVIDRESHVSVWHALYRRRSLCNKYVVHKTSSGPVYSQAAEGIMCGHCGNVYQDMCTLAHHLNVRKMHLELSKIEGYDMRTFRLSQYFVTQEAGGEQQCLLTSPLRPSTDSSLTGYAASASAVTISSTSTNREAENRDRFWSQDTDPYFLQTPPSTAGLDPADQSVLSLQTLN